MAINWKTVLVALFCVGLSSPAMATEVRIGVSVFGIIVLFSCLPAFLIIPVVVGRLLARRNYARRFGAAQPSIGGPMAIVAISAITWAIVALTFVPGFGDLLAP